MRGEGKSAAFDLGVQSTESPSQLRLACRYVGLCDVLQPLPGYLDVHFLSTQYRNALKVIGWVMTQGNCVTRHGLGRNTGKITKQGN